MNIETGESDTATTDICRTDAYAFLNISHPLTAWAVYRGILVCAPKRPGFVSVWAGNALRPGAERFLVRELAMERVRASCFPNCVSRLTGMFCFSDRDSALAATNWGEHFRLENLAELSLALASGRTRCDANWVSFAPADTNGFITDETWISKYWAGEPFPGKAPTWEMLVEGRLIVLGTDLRTRAYEIVKADSPRSLSLLELSRLASEINSDLGSMSAFLLATSTGAKLTYLLNMEEANDPAFLARLKIHTEDPRTQVNRVDLSGNHGSLGEVPNLTRYEFEFSLPKMAAEFRAMP